MIRMAWAVSLIVVLSGLAAIALISSIAGGIESAAAPWINIALTVAIVGLLTHAPLAVVYELRSVRGWPRLVALVPFVVTVFLWAVVFVVGLPGGGPVGGRDSGDIVAIFLSEPRYLVAIAAGTLLIDVPLVRNLVRRGRGPTRRSG